MASIAAEKRKNRPKYELIIALDDLDFSWTKREVQMAIFMWNNNYSIEEMAGKLRPYDVLEDAIDEVALLIMHLKRQRKIGNRASGLLGDK